MEHLQSDNSNAMLDETGVAAAGHDMIATFADQRDVYPPSAISNEPVMNEASSDARNIIG